MARDEFDVFAEESTETGQKAAQDASLPSEGTTTPPESRTRRRGGKSPSCGWGGMVCGRTTAVWTTREDRVRMFHFENPDDFRARMPSDLADGERIRPYRGWLAARAAAAKTDAAFWQIYANCTDAMTTERQKNTQMKGA